MQQIIVINNPSDEQLQELNVASWSIWTHEAAEFPWMYGSEEMCYFLEGKVTVTPKDGEPVNMAKGDLVTFPKDMECEWRIHEAVRKHYRFS